MVLGRNEGKEYLLAKPVTTIGRSELSDIGLYGDPSIAPTHAVIEALPAQKRHRLRHVADAPGQGTRRAVPADPRERPARDGGAVAGRRRLAPDRQAHASVP